MIPTPMVRMGVAVDHVGGRPSREVLSGRPQVFSSRGRQERVKDQGVIAQVNDPSITAGSASCNSNSRVHPFSNLLEFKVLRGW